MGRWAADDTQRAEACCAQAGISHAQAEGSLARMEGLAGASARSASMRHAEPGAVSLPEIFGSFRVRAVGGGALQGALLFRSRELCAITEQEAGVLVRALGIRSIYDIRNAWEVASSPCPCIVGTKTVSLEPDGLRRRKNASNRLVAGVIGEYGAPGERMERNYRRFAREYPLIGKALRAISAEGAPALVHCVNGKDRTGALCATLMRIAGAHPDDIMADYLVSNEVEADVIARDEDALGEGMTAGEHDVLMSFLEVRPEYLDAFFDEAETLYGTFDRYVAEGLRITSIQREVLALMLSRG